MGTAPIFLVPEPKSQSWNQLQGQAGESQAAAFLEKQGYLILQRRYRNQFGEIDLVAVKGDILLFVEVKSRSGPDFGDPLQSVTRRKIAHLLKAVRGFLLEYPEYQRGHYWELAAIAVRDYETGTELEMVRILP